jgi:hypothetical protein
MWTASWAAVLRFAFISRQASRRHPRSGKGPRTAGPRGKRNDSSNRRPRGPARHRLRNPHWPGVSRGGCARRGRGAGCLSRASEGNRVGGARRGASKAQRSRSLFAHGNGNKRLTGDFCQWLQHRPGVGHQNRPSGCVLPAQTVHPPRPGPQGLGSSTPSPRASRCQIRLTRLHFVCYFPSTV